MSVATPPLRPAALLRRAVPSEATRDQFVVTGGQLAAGVGNLLYALVLARVAGADYALVVAFLAAYLLIHVPLSSLSAGTALHPESTARLRRRVSPLGLAGGAALAAAALPFGGALGLGSGLVLMLAATVPVAGLLALERGRLLGEGRTGRAAATLAVEPAVRLGLGVVLAWRLGPIGAAAGVVLGGYAALAVATLAGGLHRSASSATASAPARAALAAPAGGIVAAFALLALVQNQDVLWANGLLDGTAAAEFAVLSTLGGVAAFATTTIPLVLLPRARRGERGALLNALGLAAGLGAAALVPVLIAPAFVVETLFGARYAGAAGLAAPYLAAMALLGVARVFLAHHCATAGARAVVGLVAGVALLQAGLLVALADGAAGAVTATLVSTIVLTLGAGVLALRAPTVAAPPPATLPVVTSEDETVLPASAPTARSISGPARHLHDRWIMLGLMVVALALRLISSRSLWLDEATSVAQARMSFGGMLEALQASDVHPPLHDALLWLIVHAIGDSELIVRFPSLVAGVALVPAAFLAGRELWDRRAGLVAAALTTVAPFAVWYAQEARMYALFLLFATLALYGQARATRRGDRTGWIVYVVATGLLVWTHYFALLFVGVQQLGFVAAGLARRTPDWRGNLRRARPWAVSTAAVGLICVPLLLLARAQFAANEASGRGFAGNDGQLRTSLDGGREIPDAYDVLTNAVWGMLGYHSSDTMAQLTSLWPVLILGALLVLGRGRGASGRLLVALVVLPAVALFAIGQIKPFLFEIRYAAGTVPVMLLLAARGLTAWIPGRTLVVALTAVACAGLLAATTDQQLSRTNPRLYDFEGAISRIEAQSAPGDVLLYEPEYLDDLVGYYGDGLRTQPLSRGVPKVEPGTRIFLLASFNEQPDVAERTAAGLAELGSRHRLVDRFTRPQVRVWEYR